MLDIACYLNIVGVYKIKYTCIEIKNEVQYEQCAEFKMESDQKMCLMTDPLYTFMNGVVLENKLLFLAKCIHLTN